jgi:uncharacterized protein YllA (UPF0747 family)
MNQLRWEDVAPDAGLFLALVRGRVRAPGVPSLEDAVRAAQARDLPRGLLADAIVARLRELGAPAESIAAAERLRKPGVVAVVAGQQPVLLGGPHLVVTKALAAVALARRLETRGVPAVPVFWSASEDHDHAEAGAVRVLTRDGAAERLSVSLPRDRRMLSATPVPEDAMSVVLRLAEILPDGPGRDVVLATVQPRSGDSMGTWTARVLLAFLGRFGIALVEPASLRPFAANVLEREIGDPGALAAAVRRVEQDVAVAHGFPPPLALEHPELYFVVEDGVRRRARSGERAIDMSWNVASRVLAQDAALPVAAQVCGPAEMSYCSMLGPAHALVGAPCPAFVARPGITLVEPRVKAACVQLGTTPADVIRDPSVLGRPPAPPVVEGVADLRARAEQLPEGTGAAARRRRAELLRNLDLYEEALVREAQARTAAADGRRAKVLAALRPEGRLQERELSILSFAAKHGTAILDRMLGAISRNPDAEHVVLDTVEA